MAFFNLQEGEEIKWESKPLSGLFWSWLIFSFIKWFIFGIVMWAGYYSVVPPRFVPGSLNSLLLQMIIIVVVAVILSFISTKLTFNKEYYWITNNRILQKRGFIGYQITSIPLERISDIIISRSLIEKIFGIASLNIQTLAGQYSYGETAGAEASLRAVSNPEELQKLIFKLIKEKRKTEKLTI